MQWYLVTKTINSRRYNYWQKTYREGGKVKTLNKYIGPVGANRIAPAYDTKIEMNVGGTELQALELEASFLREALSDHPAKDLADRYRLARHRTGKSLGQLNQSALGKGTASARLDSSITELGFNDLEEADLAIEEYERAAAQLRSVEREAVELRKLDKLVPRERDTEVLDEDGVAFGGRRHDV